MTKIILFNAPPKSGKDTIAKALFERHGGEIEKFAKPMYEWICNLLNITQEEAERTKDVARESLSGMTIRQALIAYSERFMKPVFGQEVWGNLLRDRVLRSEREFFWVTDLGFTQELMPVIHHFGIPSLTIIRLQRDGCTFENDSRNWVNATMRGRFGDVTIANMEFENNGTVDDCALRISTALGMTRTLV